MNDNACDDPTEQPVSLKYEVIPDATVFSGDTPAPTATAASVSTIVAGDHIPPSGPKRQTKPFYPVNVKMMSKKYTIYTTPESEATTSAPNDASARSSDLTVSNSPYLWEIAISPPAPSAPKKKPKTPNDDKVTFYCPPLPEAFSTVFP